MLLPDIADIILLPPNIFVADITPPAVDAIYNLGVVSGDVSPPPQSTIRYTPAESILAENVHCLVQSIFSVSPVKSLFN